MSDVPTFFSGSAQSSPMPPVFPATAVPAPARRKLEIGAIDDPFEREAARVAEHVMCLSAPQIAVASVPQQVRREPAALLATAEQAPVIVHDVLRSPGRPLETGMRAYFEPRFGCDFSCVRVHTGAPAERSAREMNAHAYTVGHHIVFDAGRYAPATDEGRRLLAHELTHVVQQSGGSGVGTSERCRPAVIARHAPPRISGSGGRLAREPKTRSDRPAVDPNLERVRTLAKLLHDGKRDDVLRTLKQLAPADLDALDGIIATAVPRDKVQANELHRIIRFVRHQPGPPPAGDPFTNAGGTLVSTVEVAVSGGKGSVELRTGVSVVAGSAGTSNDAYSLSYQGPKVDDMRWLQFIWREVVPEFPARAKGKSRKIPVKKRLDHGSVTYHLTTDPAKPRWSTDSASSSAFYEQSSTVRRTPKALEMFDFPSALPVSTMADDLFNSANPPKSLVSHFHASTYLINGADVLYRADIDLTWAFASQAKPQGKGAGAIPNAKIVAKASQAKQLESPQRATLGAQFPEVDYLPGPAAAAPQAADEFDPVPDLFPTNSIGENEWAGKTDLEKYADVATLAHAESIDDVFGMSATSIHLAAHVHADVKPGLNYSAAIPAEAETGYVDANGAYSNPDLPIQRDGRVPRVAIVLGPKAFARDKAFALATIRHEMRHAVHEELAIGWLVKWRDERVATPFADWLGDQQKNRHVSPTDFALISSFISLGGKTIVPTATEVLAYTEGFLTALPFLPVKPDLNVMLTKEKWPAAIAELEGVGKRYHAVSTDAVKVAALERIREFTCDTLNQKQRDALVDWTLFLLHPSSLKPPQPTKDQERAIALIDGFFGPLKAFLEAVRTSVKKACSTKK